MLRKRILADFVATASKLNAGDHDLLDAIDEPRKRIISDNHIFCEVSPRQIVEPRKPHIK